MSEIPGVGVRLVGREEIRPGIERLQGLRECFVQTVHPGTIRIAGDSALGRVHVAGFGRLRNGSGHLNYSPYHDCSWRTPDGWRSAQRVHEVRYVGTTPLTGSARAPSSGSR